MLGWMLKRGEDAPDAADGGDTTLADLPDTPAPVFAARAIKGLFGQEEPRARQTKASVVAEQESRTPNSKPQGILLTPGTGTTRQKRVSFGHEVSAANKKDKSSGAKFKGNEAPKRTRLNEALEQARKQKAPATSKPTTTQPEKTPSDDEWDDLEDDYDYDNCSHDITLDLNEPHSQSGRYWKEEFEKYHKDAKDEMEKLLKYKQLAKSYAQQKDAEAIELAEKLKDEQEKVIRMEKKIAENASHIISLKDDPADATSTDHVAKLAKQTAFAVQYRQKVKALEGELEKLVQEKQDDTESSRRRQRMSTTSPRTQRTLADTQRELRRAKAQAQEANTLRDQVQTLKQELKAAERRAAKAEASASSQEDESSRTRDLRAQLREANAESRKKDDEIHRLKRDFKSYKEDSEARDKETQAVLQRANNKMAELKKEIKVLKSAPQVPRRNRRTDEEPADVAKDSAPRSPTRIRSFEERERPERRSYEMRKAAEVDDKPYSLRDKFHEDADETAAGIEREVAKAVSGILENKPDLEQPRWQSFVPRSPRNRDYLGSRLSSKIENGGVTPAAERMKDIGREEPVPRARLPQAGQVTNGQDPLEDRLRSRFVHRSETDGDLRKSRTNSRARSRNGRSEALGAADRVEKRRANRLGGRDKENVRP